MCRSLPAPQLGATQRHWAVQVLDLKEALNDKELELMELRIQHGQLQVLFPNAADLLASMSRFWLGELDLSAHQDHPALLASRMCGCAQNNSEEAQGNWEAALQSKDRAIQQLEDALSSKERALAAIADRERTWQGTATKTTAQQATHDEKMQLLRAQVADANATMAALKAQLQQGADAASTEPARHPRPSARTLDPLMQGLLLPDSRTLPALSLDPPPSLPMPDTPSSRTHVGGATQLASELPPSRPLAHAHSQQPRLAAPLPLPTQSDAQIGLPDHQVERLHSMMPAPASAPAVATQADEAAAEGTHWVVSAVPAMPPPPAPPMALTMSQQLATAPPGHLASGVQGFYAPHPSRHSQTMPIPNKSQLPFSSYYDPSRDPRLAQPPAAAPAMSQPAASHEAVQVQRPVPAPVAAGGPVELPPSTALAPVAPLNHVREMPMAPAVHLHLQPPAAAVAAAPPPPMLTQAPEAAPRPPSPGRALAAEASVPSAAMPGSPHTLHLQQTTHVQMPDGSTYALQENNACAAPQQGVLHGAPQPPVAQPWSLPPGGSPVKSVLADIVNSKEIVQTLDRTRQLLAEFSNRAASDDKASDAPPMEAKLEALLRKQEELVQRMGDEEPISARKAAAAMLERRLDDATARSDELAERVRTSSLQL